MQSEYCYICINIIYSGNWEYLPSVATIDLCTVMEQVPELIKKTREGIYSFELDFYEQGIERRLLVC